MTETNLISIIVPVYNIEKYIEKCIQSIISQSYKNLQIILVDDGSTDGSGKICDIYEKIDLRIQVIHQKNAGLVCARKYGLKKAKGQFISFVDGDDYIDKNMYSDMLQDILKYEADFIHTGYYEEKKEGTKIKADFVEGLYGIDNYRSDFLREYVLESNPGKSISYSIWSKLFKKNLIEKCYQEVPDNQSYGEDLIALCSCVLESNRIYMKSKPYYHYVHRKGSITKSGWISDGLQLGDLYKCLLNKFEQWGCRKSLEGSLYRWYQLHMVNLVQSMSDIHLVMHRYFYPDISSLFGKSVVLYGAGNVGRDYYAQLCKYQRCKLVAWVDKNAPIYQYDYASILAPDKLNKYEYDICIVAVQNYKLANQIKDELTKFGIDEKKIVWKEPEYL